MARLKPLFQNVMAGVADQGVASSTNFVMNVLLARWLLRSDYGAFSVAWSFCLIFAGFHNALILEPITIIGPAEYGDRPGGYLTRVHRLHWMLAAALSGAALILSIFYRQALVRPVLLGLAMCLPGYLWLLMKRREEHVRHRPARALRFSVVYAVLMGIVLWVLQATGRLSAATGTLAIGVAWLAAWARGRSSPVPEVHVGERVVAREHWRYGKWLFASSVLAVGIPDVQTILLSLLVDLKSAGALRALMNFVLPLSQLMTALNIFVLPRFSKRLKESGAGSGLRNTILFPAAAVGIAVAYSAVLIVTGPILERLLYNGTMAAYLVYMPMLAAASILAVLAGGFSTLLRAAQESRHQFISGVTGTIVGVGSAFALLKSDGLRGALWSMILANGAAAVAVIAAYVIGLRKSPAKWAPLQYWRVD